MNIGGINYNIIDCVKCNHQWLSKLECPKQCPKCKRYDPWLPKLERNESIARMKRITKYPIQDVQVGESVVLPYAMMQNGWPDVKSNNNMLRAIRQEEKRKGKRFERIPIGAGLKLIRRA